MTVLSEMSEAADLRRLFGRFPAGVVAVCAGDRDGPVGMTASTFVAVSLDPPLVSVCVKKASWTWGRLRQCERIGISFLGKGHASTARQLAQSRHDGFEGLDFELKSNGAVFLNRATAWLECSVEREVDAGDHDIILMRLHRAGGVDASMPLVFHASDFHTLVRV